MVRIAHDKAKIKDILDGIDVNCDTCKTFRLGRATDKPRPLKVVFSNPDLVSVCLRNRRALKEKNVSLSADLTYLQRDEIRNAHKELENRKQNGESGLYIRYINGSPKVLVSKVSNVSKNDQ